MTTVPANTGTEGTETRGAFVQRLVEDAKSAHKAFVADIGATGAVLDGFAHVRAFDTGAVRDTDKGKLDFDGFFSPLFVEAYATYLHFHRTMADGSLRGSDNWQRGIPLSVYMKSGWRHFFEWWKAHRGHTVKEGILWALLGLAFNVQGYVVELLKADPELLARSLAAAEARRKPTA